MGGFAMFDLTSRIRQWREGLAQRDVFRPADIDELEGHVRDSVERLTSSGLSEEEAFVVALHRLGHAEALTREYAKSNGAIVWGRRLLWMLVGYLVVPLLLGVGTFLANGAVALGVKLGVEGAPLTYLNGSVFLLSMAGWIVLAAALISTSPSRLRDLADRSLCWLAARSLFAVASVAALLWLAKIAASGIGHFLTRSLTRAETMQLVAARTSPVQLLVQLLSVAAFIGLIVYTRRRLQSSAAAAD
jgi:hypothetical protein